MKFSAIHFRLVKGAPPFLNPDAGPVVAAELLRVDAAVDVEWDFPREVGADYVPRVHPEGILALALRRPVDRRVDDELHVPQVSAVVVVDPGVGEALEGVVAIDHAVRRQRVAVVELHIGGNPYQISDASLQVNQQIPLFCVASRLERLRGTNAISRLTARARVPRKKTPKRIPRHKVQLHELLPLIKNLGRG